MPNTIDNSDFWDLLQPGQITIELMDMLSDTLVFIKNTEGAYLFINKAFRKTLLLKSNKIIGKLDSSLFGSELASHYMIDDQNVIKKGQRIIEKAELVTHRPGLVKWYLTTKIPLYNKQKDIIGIAGISRPSEAHKHAELTGPMSSLGKAVEYIYEHKHEVITVDMISSISGFSISTLERNFKKYFSCSPAKFVTQVKVSRACELLAEPSYSINEIGDLLGYSDPVVFTRIFKREMKHTPSVYRKSLSTHNYEQ